VLYLLAERAAGDGRPGKDEEDEERAPPRPPPPLLRLLPLPPLLAAPRSRHGDGEGGRVARWGAHANGNPQHTNKDARLTPSSRQQLESMLGRFMLSGLKWMSAGATKPAEGRELIHPGLAEALATKAVLTQEEWEALGISDLRYDDFIEAGGSYFRPMSEISEGEGWEGQSAVLACLRGECFSESDAEAVLKKAMRAAGAGAGAVAAGMGGDASRGGQPMAEGDAMNRPAPASVEDTSESASAAQVDPGVQAQGGSPVCCSLSQDRLCATLPYSNQSCAAPQQMAVRRCRRLQLTRRAVFAGRARSRRWQAGGAWR
jgi:hypothetical protein